MRRLIEGLAILCVFVPPHSSGAAPTPGNPLAAEIPTAFWSIELEDVVSIPQVAGAAPRLEWLTGGGAPGLAYVVDQLGLIYSFDVAAAEPSPQLVLDLASAVGQFNSNLQTGVRGLAFHPDFNSPGTDGFRRLFTSHSRNSFAPAAGTPVEFPAPKGANHLSVVGEWTVGEDGVVDPTSYREVLRVGQPFIDHNIGQIGFNPNASPGDADYGNLYVAMGDGGSQFPLTPLDPHDTGQEIETPHGSILRFDPLATDQQPLDVPVDNPFRVSDDPTEARNLIWAHGFRNPHRFTFDGSGDGKMLIVDVGQANIEEVNLGVAGGNYGWSQREGSFVATQIPVGGANAIELLPPDHAADAFLYPVAQFDHDPDNDGAVVGSTAIVGGSVYRGDDVPQLTGLYLFGDFGTNSGPLYAVDVDDLQQRDDFSDLGELNDGLLAPLFELPIVEDGVEQTFLDVVRSASDNPLLTRTDLRFGVGPDDEVYVLNKRDGVVRRIAGVTGLLDGDVDRNGRVDGRDLVLWQRGFGLGDWSNGDFNGDALVDGADLAAWGERLGQVSTDISSVPEPNTITLLTLAAFASLLAGSRMS